MEDAFMNVFKLKCRKWYTKKVNNINRSLGQLQFRIINKREIGESPRQLLIQIGDKEIIYFVALLIGDS